MKFWELVLGFVVFVAVAAIGYWLLYRWRKERKEPDLLPHEQRIRYYESARQAALAYRKQAQARRDETVGADQQTRTERMSPFEVEQHRRLIRARRGKEARRHERGKAEAADSFVDSSRN